MRPPDATSLQGFSERHNNYSNLRHDRGDHPKNTNNNYPTPNASQNQLKTYGGLQGEGSSPYEKSTPNYK